MESKIYDSHFHCQSGAVGIMRNAFDMVGIAGGLVLPWENDDENVLNAIDQSNITDIGVALVPKLRLIGSDEWRSELRRIEDTAKEYLAVKIYKDYVNETQYNLAEYKEFWSLLEDLGKPVIIHFGDPCEFWMNGGGRRYVQYENHKEFQYYNNSQIRSRAEALKIKNDLLTDYGDIKFVCAHLGGFPESVEELNEFVLESYTDTSASLDDVLTFDNEEVKRIFTMNPGKILYGSDTMFFTTQDGKDGLYTKIMANYLRMNLNQLVSDELVSTSNPLELKWKVKGLGLDEKTKEQIFEKNYKQLFRIQ